MFYIRGGGFPDGGLNCLELEEEISVAGIAGDSLHRAVYFLQTIAFYTGFLLYMLDCLLRVTSTTSFSS